MWTKFLEYPYDIPNGPNYTVGQSRWSTDWNFIQPVVQDSQGNHNGSTSTINFNLAAAPQASAQASFYIAMASDYYGPVIVKVNGTSIAGATGYGPYYSNSDISIRESPTRRMRQILSRARGIRRVTWSLLSAWRRVQWGWLTRSNNPPAWESGWIAG